MNNETNDARYREVVVIGAGLTGLTTAYLLKQKNKDVEVIERQKRIGGQIQTHREDGFTFESGPNTGVVSYPEVAELFHSLTPHCELETACQAAKKRLIWKKGAFRPLPSGLISAVSTSLFAWKDKFRILGEPFRAKGTNPDESVGELALRRLGKSFLDYAVDPFLSGVYAGDPQKLITRYALPKLYNLEQNYGSFIRGSIAKAKEPKSDRDRLATKEVFSAKGGLGTLIEALGKGIGNDRITLSADEVRVQPHPGGWCVTYQTKEGATSSVICKKVVTTTGAYTLPALLPFIPKEQMDSISNLHYAPVMEIAVGLRQAGDHLPQAFGGLVPSCENQQVLGILFPSACFEDRVPRGGALLSFFVGGVRHPEWLQKTDEEIKEMVHDALSRMLRYPCGKKPDLVRIFRHEKAIPQYGINSGERFAAIDSIEQSYSGLVLGGNLKGGIGMADRIRQATNISERE